MNKLLLSSAVVLALAPVAAEAQLLGGALGGGVGLPIGSIGTMGDFGVSRAGRSVTASADAAASASRRAHKPDTPRVSTVATSAAGSATATAPTRTAGAQLTAEGAIGRTVSTPTLSGRGGHFPVVAVPRPRSVLLAVPVGDVAVRAPAIAAAGIAAVPAAEVPYYIDSQYVVVERELRGTGAAVRREGNQIVIDMPADVTFAFNRADIQPRFRYALGALAHTLNRYPSTYIDVYGHTDSIGSFSYNQVLSERRAGSVAYYLQAQGVFGGRMYTQGFGKTEPKASNATIDGRAANRRVEVVLTPYSS